MGQIVSTQLASNSLALGVSRDYADAYKKEEGSPLDGNMNLLVKEVEGKSDHWKGAYFESANIPRLWRRNEEASDQGFRDVGWTIYVDEWEQKVFWRWTDAQDDQTGTLVERAQDAGKGWWQRSESNIVQMLTGGTDTSGLASIPNAPDGVAMFSATDGAGAARFGVTGGNIVSGQSFASGPGLRAGFMAGRVRFMKMQDTVGQPLFSNVKEFFIIGSADDAAVFNEAFDQKTVVQGALTSISNAGVSNVLLDAGYSIKYFLTPRISTSTMFMVHKGARAKPIVLVNRQSPAEFPIRMENSDSARKAGIEGTQFISRSGWGTGVSYGVLKVTT